MVATSPDGNIPFLGHTFGNKIGLVAYTIPNLSRTEWKFHDTLRGFWLMPLSNTAGCATIPQASATETGLLHISTCVTAGTGPGNQLPIPDQLWDFYAVTGAGQGLKRRPLAVRTWRDATNRYWLRHIKTGRCLAINPASRFAINVTALTAPCSNGTAWRMITHDG